MLKPVSFTVMSILAVLTGLYPIAYFILDTRFGLLSTKPDELLADTLYNLVFFTHITLGGITLLVGWLQFNASFRNRNLQLHRMMGKIYVACALLSGTAGLYIAMHATGGLSSVLGFSALALLWLFSTLMAYVYIRRSDQLRHKIAMIYSYAFCFAAVTLRIWLPLLIAITGDYFVAYPIVAWLCWIPNLIFAFFLTRKMHTSTL